jgi:hypothetical protein
MFNEHLQPKSLSQTHSGSKVPSSSTNRTTKSSRTSLLSNRGKPFAVTMASPTNLKRKRELVTSTSKPRSVTTIRKVPPDPVFSHAPLGPLQVQAELSPRKPSVPVVIRRVPDIVVAKPVEVETRDTISNDEGPRSPLWPPSQTQGDIQGGQARAAAEQIEIISPIPIPVSAPSRQQDKLSMLLHSDDDTQGVVGPRRTTRPRKSAPLVDAIVPSHSQAQPRRKANTLTRTETPTFSGMSATALKALTSSNTVKNQQYLVAKLETEVVRVEGARPQSPGVKIRTIVQKQMEEQKKERQERAERRAKRGEEWQSDFEDSSFADDSMEEQNEERLLSRHRRGAGEDEDYQTPDRKPAVFGEAAEDKKRVTWDRGLLQTVYLEDVLPGERARPPESFAKKGCLAPTAKVALFIFFRFAQPFTRAFADHTTRHLGQPGRRGHTSWRSCS